MIRVRGDRVLVALPPAVDEIVSAGGIVLVKDPDRFQTPTRGLVVQVGEKRGTVDLDEVLALVLSVRDGKRSMWLALENLADMKPAPFEVQVHDCVLFSTGAGEEIEDDGIRYVILHEHEILGVVEPLSNEAA